MDYRVLEVTKGNEDTYFIPQGRLFKTWLPIFGDWTRFIEDGKIVHFKSLKEAKQSIEGYKKERKPTTTKIHDL